ncbi:hypothetical protein LUZ60_012197 [Juncus effusus]|nr:hypothetical protein LUZ60_012197 [Juncus effusus]
MGEDLKLLYVVVVDREDDNGDSSSFRYTRAVLQSTLQLMGCKPRHAFKISKRVFEVLREECSEKQTNNLITKENKNGTKELIQNGDSGFELYKRKTTVIISREKFLNIVCHALSMYKYVGPNQRADLILACRVRERKESVTILLCGTSGCGKSTLSALLGHRLGITTVVSTDSIRHMMRGFTGETENPLLWASTYHAGEFLDPVAVAQAKAKKKANKNKSMQGGMNDEKLDNFGGEEKGGEGETVIISKKQMAVEGYKAQSEMVIDSLDRLITSWEDKKESVIVEGVHLSLNFVMGLMKKHPSIIPFMIHISNETKHTERFAVRAKYMTLEPGKNKYVKYIRNIRSIQEYLLNRSSKYLIPKINNTNVDKSVASIHATVFSALRKRSKTNPLYDPVTNSTPSLHNLFTNQTTAFNDLSSKGMFRMIQRQGSSRHLMALVNTDGSVAKAWPIKTNESGFKRGEIGDPLYGPVSVVKVEEVNLQFGGFGIGNWPSDTGRANNDDDKNNNGKIKNKNENENENENEKNEKNDRRNNGKGVSSSGGSSPKVSDGPSKELMEEVSVSSSEEEADMRDNETDDDLSENEKNDVIDDMEGSVDENSTKTDEEYEDLNSDDENHENFEDLSLKKKFGRKRQLSHSGSLKLSRKNGLTKSLSLCIGDLKEK